MKRLICWWLGHRYHGVSDEWGWDFTYCTRCLRSRERIEHPNETFEEYLVRHTAAVAPPQEHKRGES